MAQKYIEVSRDQGGFCVEWIDAYIGNKLHIVHLYIYSVNILDNFFLQDIPVRIWSKTIFICTQKLLNY